MTKPNFHHTFESQDGYETISLTMEDVHYDVYGCNSKFTYMKGVKDKFSETNNSEFEAALKKFLE